MSCKSGIYVVNTQTGQSIGIGSTYVPLTVIRRDGKYCQLGGNGVSIGNCAGGAGYYDVDASVSVAATAAGNITATFFKDVAPVQGETAIATATAAGDSVTLAISALVRLNCDWDTANLTIVIGGQVVSAQNRAFVVEKI